MSSVKVCENSPMINSETKLTFEKKMSQFHWHVVDSQSFPLVIPGFLELSQKGAYSPDMIYSSKDVKDIVEYAGAVSIIYPVLRTTLNSPHQRGIDVMMVGGYFNL